MPTDEQFRVIVESIRAEKRNAEAEESANFIEFMGLAGLGQAEASSLKRGDLNWEKGQLCVRRHKTRELFFPPDLSRPAALPQKAPFKASDATVRRHADLPHP